jgi:hypothetical protein
MRIAALARTGETRNFAIILSKVGDAIGRRLAKPVVEGNCREGRCDINASDAVRRPVMRATELSPSTEGQRKESALGASLRSLGSMGH